MLQLAGIRLAELAIPALLILLRVLLPLLTRLSRRLAHLTALLPRLTLLPALLSRLALLPGLALLLTISAELPALRQLLHLLLELFGFAAQHLLFPPLLRRLLTLALLVGKFLLAFGELLQFFERIINLALARIGGLRLAGAFVLILLGVQFEIEEAGQNLRGIKSRGFNNFVDMPAFVQAE